MSDHWFLARDNKKYGPYSSAQLRLWAASGKLHPADMLRKGTGKWLEARNVRGLFSSAAMPTTSGSSQAVPALGPPQPVAAPSSSARSIFAGGKRKWLIVGAASGAALLLLVACAVGVAVLLAATRRGQPLQPSGLTRADDAPPDFSKVDYSLPDFSKLDYSKGPDGQPLVQRKGQSGVYSEVTGFFVAKGKSRLHGRQTWSDKRLGVLIEDWWFDGKQHGTHKTWNDNKTIHEEGAYVEGKRHGKWTWWYDNGQKEKETSYLAGMEHGIHREWYKNGQKAVEGAVVNGQRVGDVLAWNEKGNPIKWRSPEETAYAHGYEKGLSVGRVHAQSFNSMSASEKREFRKEYKKILTDFENTYRSFCDTHGPGSVEAQDRLGVWEGYRKALLDGGVLASE